MDDDKYKLDKVTARPPLSRLSPGTDPELHAAKERLLDHNLHNLATLFNTIDPSSDTVLKEDGQEFIDVMNEYVTRAFPLDLNNTDQACDMLIPNHCHRI